MTPKTRVAMTIAIVLLLSYSVLVLWRKGFIESPSLEGGYGAGLDASRQYIVDTGRLYTNTGYVSPWYFTRSADQQLQILNAMINILTGYTSPTQSAYLFSIIPYPTLFLIFVVFSFFLWTTPRVQGSGADPKRKTVPLMLYGLFAVFPVYTLVQPQTASYPGYLAPVYMLFILTLLVRRAVAKRSTAAYVAVIAIGSFAFFNMYHSFSLELTLMISFLFGISLVSTGMRALRDPSTLLLVLYCAVGVYQNIVLITEPANLLTYLSDWRATQSFILNAPPNRATEIGNPATRLFGIGGIIIIGSLGLLFLWKYLKDRRDGIIPDAAERLTAWIFCSSALPLVPLFALGGIDYVANRFRDQVFVWVLLLILPFVVLYSWRANWRRLITALLVLGIVGSIVGSFVTLGITPQSYLTPEELQTTTFIWSRIRGSDYVISDWTHGTVLMYRHMFLFGPDPYKMNESLFENSTRALFYSTDTEKLPDLLRSMVNSDDYTLFLSEIMATQGPTGPTQSYVPAVSTILSRFQDEPRFNVIYSTGQTILVQPSGH